MGIVNTMISKAVPVLLFCSVTVISGASIIYAEGNDNETREGVIVTIDHGPPAIKPKTRAGTAQWGWFYPRLDHYNDQDQTTWPMRYTYNLQFARANGPIFIYVGGEWTIDTNSIEGGQIWDMARENGGSLWYTEHRFYGQSKPKPDFSTDNLRYLHSLQAIRDNIEFIQWLKSSSFYANSKVVLMGCSYSASMVTWARELFPNDVFASYASSGPLLAIDNFEQYFEVVGTVIRQKDENCWNTIKNGVAQLEQMYDQDGGQQAREMFRACGINAPNPSLDKTVFFNSIGNSFAGTVQYAQDGTVEAACNDLVNSPGNSDAEKLASYVTRNLESNQCWSASYSAYVDYYVNINSDRQWLYQTCNEFGFFQTSRSQGNQPFGNSFSDTTYNHQLCRDAYTTGFSDEYITQAQDITNNNYGGLTPQITRVVSVHGRNDPWSSIGLQQAGDDAPLYIVDGASHCADIGSVSNSDSDPLRDAKNGVRTQIKNWLQQQQ